MVGGDGSAPPPFLGGPSIFHSWQDKPGTALDDFVQHSFTSGDTLHPMIYKFQMNVNWSGTADPTFDVLPGASMTSGMMYVTWGPPLNGEKVTHNRLNWAVTKTQGSTTVEAAADNIWEALDNDPPIEPAYAYPEGHPLQNHNLLDCESVSVWNLLDGTRYGECDEQARLMAAALNLLGIDAAAALVYASSDVNVEDLQTTLIGGRRAYLFLDFVGTEITSAWPGENERWNQYEGVCRVPLDGAGGERVYSVWPMGKTTSMLNYLLSLLNAQVKQYWIYLSRDPLPNEQTGVLTSGWRFDGVANLSPVTIDP